jgi:hypothetical protein
MILTQHVYYEPHGAGFPGKAPWVEASKPRCARSEDLQLQLAIGRRSFVRAVRPKAPALAITGFEHPVEGRHRLGNEGDAAGRRQRDDA